MVVTYNDVTEIKQAEGVLHKAYDELEVRVKERTKELKELNDTLEQRISERTAELRAANRNPQCLGNGRAQSYGGRPRSQETV